MKRNEIGRYERQSHAVQNEPYDLQKKETQPKDYLRI
jgi:hypothetical protein